MAKIGIPEGVIPGFTFIYNLSKNELNSVLTILDNIKPVQELDDVDMALEIALKKPSTLLLQTIISFIGLIEKDGETPDDVAKNLTESYNEKNEFKSNPSKITKLRENLLNILQHSKSLRRNILTRKSRYDNEAIMRTSKSITDMRLIFDEDLKQKDRHAIIIHKIHIEYQKDFEDKEIYLTLDLKDLNRLKVEIEKAIEKDQIIREDYKETLNFLF